MCLCRLDDPEYSAPAYLRLPTVLLFLLSGFAVSALLNLSLGDATWGVSTGAARFLSAACFSSAICIGFPDGWAPASVVGWAIRS